ncbi:Hypothetical protein A7982_06684 [Minicystis rosea]|nr:Hypothetical protein A7982_06684 [Minicystis rosea]
MCACVSLLAVPAAAATLTVTTSAPLQIPADGKTVIPVQVELADDKGPSSDGTKIDAAVTGELDLLTPAIGTVGGKGTLFVKARGKPGKGTLKVSADHAERTIEIDINPADLDLATIFARLGAFFVLMMLLSLGAEKAVDVIKLILTSAAGKKWRPKPRLASYLSKDQSLVSLDDAALTTIHRLMIGPPAATATTDDKRAALEAADTARASVDSIWTWGTRLVAAGIGVLLAFRLDIDLVALLAPAGVHATAATGHILTGFGASAGAAFWQDMLDKMTAAKKVLEAKSG